MPMNSARRSYRRAYNNKRKSTKRTFRKYLKRKNIPSLIGYIKGSQLGFPFPSMLATRLRTSFVNAVSLTLAGSSGNASDYFIKLNGLVNQGIFGNYPLGTLAGSGSNAASGLYNLLSPDSISGQSVAPYAKYLVRSSSIMVQFASSGTTNQPVTMIICPISSIQSATTISTSHLKEQPYARSFLYPQVLNEEARKHKHSISMKKLYGLTSLDTTDAPYTGIALSDPVNLSSWQVRLGNADGTSTTSITGVLNIEVISDVIFFDRNYISSTIPA